MHINSSAGCLGIIGNPLTHSLSPLIHNSVLALMELNYVYVPFEISREQVPAALEAMRSLNIKGFNVTVPYKEAVIPYLDEISATAAACGAVNVIKNEQGRLYGYNTDGQGFIRALTEEGVTIAGRTLLIGAGGAARAVSYELAQAGMEAMDFLDLDGERAARLAEFIAALFPCRTSSANISEASLEALMGSADLIVNCSPVGMSPETGQSPVKSYAGIRPGTVVYDLIYNPLQTRFLEMAGKAGARTLNGLGMLIHQAALTLEILLGVSPPVEFMKEVAYEHLQS